MCILRLFFENDFILYVLLFSHVQGKLTNFPTCVTVFYYCTEIPAQATVTEKSMCWCRFGSGGGFLGWSVWWHHIRMRKVRGNGHVVKQKAKERLRVWVYSLFFNHLFWWKPQCSELQSRPRTIAQCDARTIGSHLRPQWEPSFLHVDPWGKT